VLADATGSTSLSEGVVLGLVAGVGTGAPILFVTGVLYPAQPKPHPLARVVVVSLSTHAPQREPPETAASDHLVIETGLGLACLVSGPSPIAPLNCRF
jgi:hypothetical protein